MSAPSTSESAASAATPPEVTLANVASPPRPITVHLPHEPVCQVLGRCLCSRTPVLTTQAATTPAPALGPRAQVVRRTPQTTTRRIPASLTLLAKGTQGATVTVPRAYLHAPEVKEAIAARALRVVEPAATPEGKAATAKAPEPQAAPSPTPKTPKSAREATPKEPS